MGLFKKRKKIGLISDVIRCDESSYLIWKWHPDGTQPGEHKREYAIRSGSILRVKEGEVAVFVYKQKNGTMQDYVVGPYDEKLKTANLPVLSGLLGAFVGGDTPFQAEVYFINLAHIVQVKFAVPFFDIYDPRFADFGVPVAVRGTISFRIEEYREFIKLHRVYTFDLEDFQKQIRDAVSRYVKNVVANAPAAYHIPVVQIENKTAQINDAVETDIGKRLQKDFGVVVSGVDIGAIEIDKTSDGYRRLAAITKDITTMTIRAQTEANLEHYTDSLRIQREEGQYATHKATQTANLSAFQVEKQAEVGIAGAEALGQMGANGAGDVNLGGGFNMASIMASMAVGGAVGQNIASTMNSVMGGGQQPVTPPPITATYFVALGGQATGPFDVTTLAQMAREGKLTVESLVWKNGMAAWSRAGEVEELRGVFPSMPPIPPLK